MLELLQRQCGAVLGLLPSARIAEPLQAEECEKVDRRVIEIEPDVEQSMYEIYDGRHE